MFKILNKLLDYIRRWKYIETKYDPERSLAQNAVMGSDKTRAQDLEKIYEWNYENLRGEWDHISKWIKKGRLCKAKTKHFFVFKRSGDAVAFKLQWDEWDE